MKGLKYSCSNESLSSIVDGLDLDSDDVVLAIGGSGDQPFALLEKAKSVFVAEMSEVQVNFIRKRIEHLLAGDFEASLMSDVFGEEDNYPSYLEGIMKKKRSRDYFAYDQRWQRIADKLDCLTVFDPANILSVAPGITYSKLYLSNILTYRDWFSYKEFCILFESLSPGGLIYVTDTESNYVLKRFIDQYDMDLVFDPDLSSLAQGGVWRPHVYRKGN